MLSAMQSRCSTDFQCRMRLAHSSEKAAPRDVKSSFGSSWGDLISAPIPFVRTRTENFPRPVPAAMREGRFPDGVIPKFP